MRPGVALACLGAAIAAALGSGTPHAADPGAPTAPGAEPPGVTREQGESWTRWTVRLPGVLLGYALPRSPTGERQLFVLMRPLPPLPSGNDDATADPCAFAESTEPQPTEVHRVALGEEPTLARVAVGAPGCAALDAFDADGDGADELLLGCPGTLYELEPEGPDGSRGARAVVEDPDFAWTSFHPRAVRGDVAAETTALVSIRNGRLDLWRLDGTGGWKRTARIPLPVDASVYRDRIEVRTHLPRELGREPDGSLLFAARAENVGDLRVRSELIHVSPQGEVQSSVSWSRLPAPEDVLERRFLLVAGRPMLWVATKPADKLGLFGEKRVRLYALERDRSRLGLDPVFATESRMNLWQPGEVALYDANGDGADDLVLGYWKGLIGSTAVLDVYLGDGEGGFARSARSTELEVKKGDRSFVVHGRDLNGDGSPDLLVRGRDGLLLFPGRPAPKGRKLVEPRPQLLPLEVSGADDVEIRIGSDEAGGPPDLDAFGAERPRIVDLDGDGLAEILLPRRGAGRGGRIVVLRPCR